MSKLRAHQGATLFGAASILTDLEMLRRAHLNPRIVHPGHTGLPLTAPCPLAPVQTPAIKIAYKPSPP